MNRVVMSRIVWKEFRQLLTFFVVMVGLAGFLQILVTVTLDSTQSGLGAFGEYAYGIVGMFATLFAAACGATLYALEKEDRTFQNLQRLPLNGWQLLSGKLAAALALSAGFLLLATGIAAVSTWLGGNSFQQASELRDYHWLQIFLGTFGLGMVEFFVWSWLFSLLCNRTLVAAMLGIFFASAGIQLAIILHPGLQIVDYSSPLPYLEVWEIRSLIAGLVLLACAALASNWLQSATDTGGKPKSGLRQYIRTLARPGLRFYDWYRRRSGQAGLLMWQSVRESWQVVALIGLVLIAAATVAGFGSQGRMLPVSVVALLMIGGFTGLVTSLGYRWKEGHEFLTARGVSPGLVWFSGIAPWTVALVVLHVVVYVVLLIGATLFSEEGDRFSTLSVAAIIPQITGNPAVDKGVMMHATMFRFGMLSGYMVLGSLLCLVAGQLTSLLIRSRILAAVATIAVCIPVIAWLTLMMAGAVPIWWSVLPLGIAGLLAGWLATRGLLVGHSAVSRVTAPVLLVVAVAVAAGFAVSRYRMNEIPPIDRVEFDRGDDPDRALLTEIRKSFDRVVLEIERPDQMPGDLARYYAALLAVDSTAKDPAEDIWRHLEETDYANWRQGVLVGRLSDVGELKRLADDFLSSNRQPLASLHEVTGRAFRHIGEFRQLPPRPWRLAMDESPLPRHDSVRELLELDFQYRLANGQAGLAWQDLKTMARLKKLYWILAPQSRFWYPSLLKHFADWALCDNQDPRLLLEALEFVRDEFEPVDEQRVLEYQYNNLLRTLGSQAGAWSKSDRQFAEGPLTTLFSPLGQLPAERQRLKRLVDALTVSKLERLQWTSRNSLALPSGWDSIWGMAPRYGGGTGRTDRETLKQIRDGARHWLDTTVVPPGFHRVPLIAEYDAYPSRREYHQHQETLRRHFGGRVTLLQAQLWLVRHKLETGRFPENLNQLYYWLRPDRLDSKASWMITVPVFYFPEGLPERAEIRSSRPQERGEFIPARTAFVTNRQPVPRLAYGRMGIPYPHGYRLPKDTGATGGYDTVASYLLLEKPE